MTDSPHLIAAAQVPADNPRLAALLDFTPVPRKYKRANAWTPALQRRFIALLAETGSPAKAAEALGKDRFGIEKVYKSDGAESFREAWAAAIAWFEEREAARQEAETAPWAGVRPPPGVDHRMPGPKGRDRFEPAEETEPELDDETKLAMVENLARKFMRKVMAEREARIAGEVVAADFYLRQVTALEVAFDLLTEGAGLDGWQALRNLRRGGHAWLAIAETPLSRALDQMRRDYWRDQQQPERPEHPPERYTELRTATRTGADGERYRETYRIEPLHCATGALSIPAEGYSAEQWAAMGHDEQVAAMGEQHARDAAAQVAWERDAVSGVSPP